MCEKYVINALDEDTEKICYLPKLATYINSRLLPDKVEIGGIEMEGILRFESILCSAGKSRGTERVLRTQRYSEAHKRWTKIKINSVFKFENQFPCP